VVAAATPPLSFARPAQHALPVQQTVVKKNTTKTQQKHNNTFQKPLVLVFLRLCVCLPRPKSCPSDNRGQRDTRAQSDSFRKVPA
jgi:hypothetical protein